MRLASWLEGRNAAGPLGFAFFVAMMAMGYFYNLTFVQLGLVDLGERVIGLGEGAVAADMALFAVVTSAVALALGYQLQARGWGESLRVKLRIALVAVGVQTLLTAATPLVATEAAYLVWILAASAAMGLGVPATFGMTVDLVPVRHRGLAGGLIAGLAFFPAAAFASSWRIEELTRLVLPLMVPGALALGLLALGAPPFGGLLGQLEKHHLRAEYGRGRFVGTDEGRIDGRLLAAVLAMFAIYFVDSLGFLRIVVTPVLVATTWQSPDAWTLVYIGAVHVLGAFIAAQLYRALGVQTLFLWIFGIFAIVHLSYAFQARLVPDSYVGLGTATLYALGVSMYTVVNFALWADLSTPRTIGFRSALGVALSGWMATFLSTALSLQWRIGLGRGEHFGTLAALALALFTLVLLATAAQLWNRATRRRMPR